VYPVAGAPTLVCSYHPSQQNTFTGRLTPAMLAQVFRQAQGLIAH
jgi:uracil-DNA glycosylase